MTTALGGTHLTTLSPLFYSSHALDTETRAMGENALTALPVGVFRGLTALEIL